MDSSDFKWMQWWLIKNLSESASKNWHKWTLLNNSLLIKLEWLQNSIMLLSLVIQSSCILKSDLLHILYKLFYYNRTFHQIFLEVFEMIAKICWQILKCGIQFLRGVHWLALSVYQILWFEPTNFLFFRCWYVLTQKWYK